MTFEAREESIQQGAPIELYDFVVYGVHHYFTTAGEDITIGPVTYRAEPIARSEIEETDELPRNNLTLTVPRDFEMLSFYDAVPPSEVILLAIGRHHRDDSEVQPWWNGRVTNGVRLGASGQLFCESVYSSLKHAGLRRLYSRRCPHVLYGLACGAQDTLHRVLVTVGAVAGIEIDAIALAAFADGRFAGGFIEWEAIAGQKEIRGIKTHVGSRLTVTHQIPGLAALEQIFVYKGCKHDLADCNSEFANTANYGGFPFVPLKNPMGQNSVF